jgi:hypothetical protein
MAENNTKIRITAVDDATRTLNSIRTATKDLTGDFGKLTGALSAIGVTGALVGLAATVKSAIDAAAAMQELSQKTGIATKELTALDYAMRREGVSTEAFGKAMQQLSKHMVEAGDATSKAGQLFKVLGIDVNAGPREAVLKLADAFAKMPDGATKAAVAMEFLGKAGADLIPALNNGAAGIREIEEEARKLGITFGEDLGKSAKEFSDKLFALQESAKKLGVTLAEEALPGLNRITSAMLEAAKESGTLQAALVGLGGVMSELLGLNDDEAQKTKKRVREIKDELTTLSTLDREGPGLLERITGSDQTEKIRERIRSLKAELESLQTLADAKAGKFQDQNDRRAAQGRDLGAGRRLEDSAAAALRGAPAPQSDPAKNLLIQLQLEYQKLNDLTKENETLERVLAELKKDSYAKASQGLKDQVVAQAKLIDEKKRELEIDAKRFAENKKDLDAAEKRGAALEELSNTWAEATEQLEQELKMLGLSNVAREKAVLLEKARADILAAGDNATAIRDITSHLEQQLGLLDAIEKKEQELKDVRKDQAQQLAFWEDLASAAGNFFADLVTNGRSAFDRLRSFVKQLLADMIALFAKRWILQLAAGATGSTALTAAAGQVGQGTITGAIGNWLGSTAIGSYVSGGFEGFQMGVMSGVAGPGAGMMESFGAAINGAAGALGIFAAVVIAGIAAMKFWKDGWRDVPSFNETVAGPHPMVNDSRVINRLLQAIGFSDRDAFTMSGGPIMSRIWGHRARQNDAFGVRGTVGPFGIVGENWQDWSQRGGLFRSDIRGTDVAALAPDQQSFFDNLLRPITSVVQSLGQRYGIDPRQTLAGYTRDFNLQLNENGEMLSDEKLSKLFGDLFGEVLRDQVALMLKAGGDTRLADYVAQLTGSGEEVTAAVQNVLGLLDAIDALGDAIEILEGGPVVALQKQIEAMNKRVEKGKAALTAALSGGDPAEILAAEKELAAAIMDRYNAEIKMVRDLQAAIRQTEEAAYQFAINIAARINAVGGTRDIGAIALNRANTLRDRIGGNAPTAFQLEDLQGYVGAIDTWYNARRDAIMRDAEAQAAAANAIYQAQASAAQARVSALEKELDLALAFQDLVDRTTEMLREMSLSAMNPLPITGRLAIASDEVTAARTSYQTSTGQDRAAAANKLLDALVRQRDLGMEAFARPSQEWQDLYNSIVREISGIQDEAKPAAERAVELQAQIVQAQLEANRYAQMTADASAIAASAMQALDEEARGYYEFAEAEANRLFGIQRAEQQTLLDTITGGMEPNFFIAQRTSEMVAELRGLRADLRTWARTPAPPSGTPPNNNTGTGNETGAAAAGAEKFVIETVKKAAPLLKRTFANA